MSSLKAAVVKQTLPEFDSEWANYYQETNYSEGAANSKSSLVGAYLASINKPIAIVQDLGANNGRFSRIAASHADLVVSQDIDPNAVNANYAMLKHSGPHNILPLELDLTAPTPAIGWENNERDSFMQRRNADVILALALIHHLAISNNLPLAKVAETLAKKCRWLIIEFVPKEDGQVEILLATRPDIFPNYSREEFEADFAERFDILKTTAIEGTVRTLYLMESKTWS